MQCPKKRTSEIVETLNKEKNIGVFMHLAKALDTVSYCNLLDVREHYGVRGTALKLLASYLTDRMQVIKINKIINSNTKVCFEIAQGTVICPTYINSLLCLETDGLSIAYANDTVVIFASNNWNDTIISAINKILKI